MVFVSPNIINFETFCEIEALWGMAVLITFRILTEKMHPKIKLSAYEKYEYGHLGRWYIK